MENERRKLRYKLKKTAQELLPAERVNLCMNRPIADVVKVFQSVESLKAFFGGLIVCGSVWNCPVCSAKISEKRRLQLNDIMTCHRKDGGKLAMLTLTFSHSKYDLLRPNIQALTDSIRRFRSGKRFARLKQKYNIVGFVRSFEITHGRNGWHPHFHLLIFYKSDNDILYEMGNLYEMWQLATKANGLNTNIKAFDLSNEKVSTNYVTKWGLDFEMTKGQVKMAKHNGRTPFQILLDVSDLGDDQDKKLFQEYAKSMKGKCQLQYTAGLKKMYHIHEKTDEELANEQTELAVLLGIYDASLHQKIVDFNLQHTALSLFEEHGFINGYIKLNEIISQNESIEQNKKSAYAKADSKQKA